MTDADKQDPQKILDRLTTHFAPKTNSRLTRFNLQRMQQGSVDTVDDYVARLRLPNDQCEFTGTERPHRILEQLIFGSSHPKMQEKMLVKREDFTWIRLLTCVRPMKPIDSTRMTLKGAKLGRLSVKVKYM